MSSHATHNALRDLEADVRKLEEEVVAAEYVATEEAMENVGSVFDTLATLQEIQREQWRFFVEDGSTSLRAWQAARDPSAVAEVVLDHWQRRSRHVLQGIEQTASVLAKESQFLANTFVEMWRPFVALVRQDWGDAFRSGRN